MDEGKATGAAPATHRLRHDIDPRLLEILVCPIAKTSLDFDAERGELISRQARLAYPIRDGVPVMIPEEARCLDEDT